MMSLRPHHTQTPSPACPISLSLSLSPALPLSFSLYIWNNKSMQNLQDKYKELLDAWQQKLQGFILNDEGYKHSVSSD